MNEVEPRLRPPLDVTADQPLAPLTTLGIGGPARYFAAAGSVAALREGIAWAGERGMPLLVLGGGSNLLVADRGFPGLALRVELRGLRARMEGEVARVEAAAGEVWDDVVAQAVARGWAGIECLSGIPGLVGATPIQNVGAYGQEVSDTVLEVAALDRRSGELVRLSNQDCAFGYRTSRFKVGDGDRYVVCSVTYRLRPGGAPTRAYSEIDAELAGIARPGLGDVRRAVLAVRRRKGMVVDAADPDSRSAGSFFVNPWLAAAEHRRLVARCRAAGLLSAEEELPGFRNAEGAVKVPAAWLIERAGFRRGEVRGNVGISGKHALAIVNRGGATAAEVVALVGAIQERVADRFGIQLVPEPVFVGFE